VKYAGYTQYTSKTAKNHLTTIIPYGVEYQKGIRAQRRFWLPKGSGSRLRAQGKNNKKELVFSLCLAPCTLNLFCRQSH
jgi:hypothetical protein